MLESRDGARLEPGSELNVWLRSGSVPAAKNLKLGVDKIATSYLSLSNLVRAQRANNNLMD